MAQPATAVEIKPASDKTLDVDVDWRNLLDPEWANHLSFSQKISKLKYMQLRLPENEKQQIWLALARLKSGEVTAENLSALCALFSASGAMPSSVNLMAREQWKKLLFAAFEDNKVLEVNARHQLIRDLMPPEHSYLQAYDFVTISTLLQLYEREVASGRAETPVGLALSEVLLNLFAQNSDVVGRGTVLRFEAAVLDHVTKKQSELLQIIPNVSGGENEATQREALHVLEKKLQLIEKYKGQEEPTKLAIAAAYFNLGQLQLSKSFVEAALTSLQNRSASVPVSDQRCQSEVAVAALCLARVALSSNDCACARKNLNIAKQILPEISNGYQREWEAIIPAIEAEIALKSGDKKTAETLYKQADDGFDAQSVRGGYERFLKSSDYLKTFLPSERAVLQGLIKLLRENGEQQLAQEKEQTLEKIIKQSAEKSSEETLSRDLDRCKRNMVFAYLDPSNCSAQNIMAAVRASSCAMSYKLSVLERLARSCLDHSRFEKSIALITATLADPALSHCQDFDLHAIYLHQLKIRAEVSSGLFNDASADISEFLARPTPDIPKLRNQRLDVLGWQARLTLLGGHPDKARFALEEVCKEWDKEGTNEFISDFREHLRDLAIAYYETQDYQLAAKALRYYLANASYHNGSEAYQAQSLLARCYQKLGNIGLAQPLIDAVIAAIEMRTDDVEQIYTVTNVADFYSDLKENEEALKYYHRARLELKLLNLGRLPVFAYVKSKVIALDSQ
jgi:hypothetical protein